MEYAAEARVARLAMATRFEIVLRGGDPVALRAAGEEALEEIGRLERQLSAYRPGSDLSQINARAAAGPVPVEPGLFRLLAHTVALAEATGGAFDPTVRPLLSAWGFVGGSGRRPDEAALAAARDASGYRHLLLDPERFTVAFARPGVSLDLGAIGKGFALARAARLLDEAGVRSALLHGGTSTVAAVGQEAWPVGVEHPVKKGELLQRVSVRGGRALSVSAVHGKAFTDEDGRLLGHVLDPRTGQPARGTRLAAVVGPDPTAADALSTALLVLGPDGLAHLPPGCGGLILGDDDRTVMERFDDHE